jgi:RNA polymerase sigma-70 factor (ECF subfamily)
VITTGDPAQSASADELLARARAGDTEAFCALASPHESRLLQQACGLCRDQSSAEDLASETLVEAWRSLKRFDGSCRLSTWLFSILLHRYQKYLRRARSRPVSLAQLDTAVAENFQQKQLNIPTVGPSPAEDAAQRESTEHLRAAVESLPEKHRQVVLLRFFEEASLPEIATVLGCSVGTVKSRLHYALEKLREMESTLNLSGLREDKSL